MKFEIELLPVAQEELNNLDNENIDKVLEDYKTIEDFGTDGVVINSLGDKIFEIKTDKIRSLFVYQPKKIILIGLVFMKKTKKTPKKVINAALKRLSKYL